MHVPTSHDENSLRREPSRPGTHGAGDHPFADRDLINAEARYRSLFENALCGIYQTRPEADGLLDANAAFAALLGYPSPAALLTTLRDLDAVYVLPGRRREFQRLLETQGTVTGLESEIRRPDGTRLWIAENARAVRDAEGRLLRYEGMAEDVTARRQAADALLRTRDELEDRVRERTAELALFNGTLLQQIAERERAEDTARRSESKFRALTENAQDLTTLVTPDGFVLYVSPSIGHLLGYGPDEIIGGNVLELLVHPDDRAAVGAQWTHIVESGTRYVRSETRFRHRDGSWRLLESIASCAPGDFPIVSLIINSRDITDRRRVESQHEERVRQQTAVAELGRFALQGPELPAILEKAAEIIARALEVPFGTVSELLPDGTHLRVLAAFGWPMDIRGRTVANWRAQSPDGQLFNSAPLVIDNLHLDSRYATLPEVTRPGGPVSVVSVVIHSGGRPFGTLVAMSATPREFGPRDVTFLQTVADLLSTLIEGKRQEAVSREAEARYQRIVANIPGAVYQYILHPDGTASLPFMSEGCRQLYGMDAATLQADPTLSVKMLHHEDRPAHDEAIAVSARTLQSFEWEGRIRLASGETRWIAARSRPELQPSGDILWDGLVLDVSELKRAQENMRAAKEEAERANAAKSEFLSRVSHELRTPLNAILGFGQLLSLDPLAPMQASSVDQILRSGRHLLDLINEVLEIARIGAGDTEMVPERVEAVAALAEAAAFTRPLADQRSVGFVAGGVPADGALAVTADRARLKQVLLNLFSNAVKYNRDGGEVRYAVEARPDGQTVRLSVIDTGPGLESDEVAKLFTPFQRLGASSRGIAGTGIGLTIAKGLVEAMGGTLGVSSTPGRGSTFFVDLPAATDAPPAAGSPPAADGPAVAAVAMAAKPAVRTVLHVDDQEDNLLLIERLLDARRDVRLISALDGQRGLELAREHRPDLILLDLHLPDVSGEEVVRRLHDDERTQNIPVVVLSADAVAAQVSRLRQLGVADYVVKPFKLQVFLKMIDTLLQPLPAH